MPTSTTSPSEGGGRTWFRATALGLLLSLRLLLLIPALENSHAGITTDSIGYMDLAQSLLADGSFDSDEHTETMRTPGYPLFIAAAQWLAGPGVEAVVVAQVLLFLGVTGLLFRLGDLTAGRSVAWAAAFLWALNPNSMFWPLVILSETLFATLLVASLLASVLALRRRSMWLILVAGVLLSLAVVVRPIGIYLVPLWSLVFLVRGARWEGWARGWRGAAIMCVAGFSLVFAWSARNYAVRGEFFFSKISGSTLRSFILARALADARGISRSDAAELISISSNMAAVATEIFTESPWSIPRVVFGGVARTALGTEAETWLHLVGLSGTGKGLLGFLLVGDMTSALEVVRGALRQRDQALYWALFAWGALYAVVAWLAAFAGWVRNRRRLDWVGETGHWLAALSVLYLVVSPLATGDARFRIPADPLLAFLAGIAFLRGPSLASRWVHAESDPEVRRKDSDRSSDAEG